MTKWKIYNEDAVEWANNYQKGKFHALLCDAPYHLTSIVKRFGKNGSAPAKHGTDGAFQRSSAGFMGQQWDGGDIAFRPETWSAFKEVLYPGAFGMAFSASRNWHRMAVAIEDAGFIIHPTMFFLWVQGQGFPKATNISKQLDKGQEGEIIGKKKLWGHNAGSGAGSFSKNQYEGHTGETRYEDVHAPASEMSEAWQGHRYGLQALKPSVEPIIVFQKPYEGRPLDNIVSTGAGTLNIDGGRIPLATDDEYTINTFDDGAKPFGNGAGHKYTSTKVGRPLRIKNNDKGNEDAIVFNGRGSGWAVGSTTQGRWPANLILDEGSAERLDAQSGVSARVDNRTKGKAGTGMFLSQSEDETNRPVDLGGGASRFFYQVSTQLDEADPFYYCSKVSPKERNAGLDEFPDVRTGAMEARNRESMKGQFDGPTPIGKNNHPTLKPIALAKYLATLLLPPAEYAPRRIFVPFSGVASEMIGAGLAGWEHVVGVEFDTENGYVDIAKKRLEYWLK